MLSVTLSMLETLRTGRRTASCSSRRSPARSSALALGIIIGATATAGRPRHMNRSPLSRETAGPMLRAVFSSRAAPSRSRARDQSRAGARPALITASGTTTYPSSRVPAIGSNVFASSLLRSCDRRQSERRSCPGGPRAMFPFKKSAGYPNIGRETMDGSAGWPFRRQRYSSGGDFFPGHRPRLFARGA